jgi:hypothetical protein
MFQELINSIESPLYIYAQIAYISLGYFSVFISNNPELLITLILPIPEFHSKCSTSPVLNENDSYLKFAFGSL